MSGVSSSPCRLTSECAEVSRTVFWYHPGGAHPQQILQGHWHHGHDDPIQHKDIPPDVFSRTVDSGGHSDQYTIGTVHTCATRRSPLFHTGIREILANHDWLQSSRPVLFRCFMWISYCGFFCFGFLFFTKSQNFMWFSVNLSCLILCINVLYVKVSCSYFSGFYTQHCKWTHFRYHKCWTDLFGNMIMAYSHCNWTGPGQIQGMWLGAMGPNIWYRNVHTGLKQGKEPGSIVSCCTGPVSCTCPAPVPVHCE